MGFYENHKVPLNMIISSIILGLLWGALFSIIEGIPLWHGEYDALANTVTMGGDVQPSKVGGYVINTLECVTVILPLGASLPLFITSLLAGIQEKMKNEIKEDVQVQLAEHHDSLKTHIEERLLHHLGDK